MSRPKIIRRAPKIPQWGMIHSLSSILRIMPLQRDYFTFGTLFVMKIN